MMRRSLVGVMAVACLAWAAAGIAHAAYVQVQVPLEQLPQEHKYQQQLRAFMATLTEKDFEVERKALTVAPADAEEQYRMWLLALHLPNLSFATLPAAGFTVKSIESQKGLLLPMSVADSQYLAWLASWDYPGNPHCNSRALKLRAFMLVATDVMMLDYLYAHDPRGADRADYLGGNLIWIGYTYGKVKDVLPKEALAAFDEGVKKLVLTINKWGPKGLMTDMDLFAPVGLWYIKEATNDAEVKKVAEDFSRQLFTDPRYFHPAGYFVDNGCFDTSYNGISLYFTTWAALISDWEFTHGALDKAFRLRAHLSFPDPDGSFTGPSAMCSRCSSDPPHDQWQFPQRHYATAMVTDEALYLAPIGGDSAYMAAHSQGALPRILRGVDLPSKIQDAPEWVIGQLNTQLAEQVKPNAQPWKETHWSNGTPFAYDNYRKGTYQRRLKLEAENSPLLRSLYERGENFVHEFAQCFWVVREPTFAAAIHTGPVGKSFALLGRPYGYGGGELSVFWTPATGAVIACRRRGAQGDDAFDSYDQWRSWPVHAVSGLTAEERLVTSSRIKQPAIVHNKEAHDLVVSGEMPSLNPAKQEEAASGVKYERHFLRAPDGLTIRTLVTSDGNQRFRELYETIPIFLREVPSQEPARVLFQVGDRWLAPAEEPVDGVRAIKVERFKGSALITFAKPVRVTLWPLWKDGFQTKAECRTALVSLLEGGARPAAVKSASIEYKITAGK